MAKILIDARFYGLEHSGLGRYTINLISELQKIESSFEYAILLRKKYFNELNFKYNWKKILADFPHYTVKEQLHLPSLIAKEKPDLVHFPHLNVPLGYHGPFVVTIHDLIMHKQGIEATTLPIPIYFAKRIPFKLVTRSAVKRANHIIVPSNSVKDEIIDYYKVNENKITVTHEGFAKDFVSDNRGAGETEILSNYGLPPNQYLLYVGNAYPHKNLKKLIKLLLMQIKTG